ncbi:protein seele isoform X2 [Nilaparvata lugens]|uniref:protein seele isoform X2 n=1 Tax=Nilaparvata lugens TaxID=108931 RepID=UPI00193E28BF|nr:protein seele isoform X2 [Nilaparvata lugens]
MFNISLSKLFLAVSLFPLVSLQLIQENVNYKELRCLVCKETIKQIAAAVEKVDPSKKVPNVFRIDGDGNTGGQEVEFRRSEVFLIELMESVCDKMEDYVKAKHKTTGEIVIFPLTLEGNKMNPIISEVDIIQDPGLNKNIKLYCEEIVETYDEEVINVFKIENDIFVNEFCSVSTSLCQSAGNEKEEL